MDTVTLSTKGQLVIPAQLRQALHLRAGDRVALRVEGDRLILERASPSPARLVRRRGHAVLVAPKGAPAMRERAVKAILADFP